MIFCFFLTAGHLPHSTLVADRNFLTAEAKNVYNYSRNFSVRGMPHRRNSYVFFFFSWPERERDRRSQVSLSFVSLSFTLYFTLVGGAIRPTVGRPHGSTIVVFFSVQLELVQNTLHAPGRLFESVACPSASGRDPTRVSNQNLQLRNQ